MKEIFISWSKSKSGELAKYTKHILEALLPNTRFFMSEEDIHAGECVQDTIIRHIEQCDILILCFTSENKKSPWLLYEAGYASGLHKRVIPFLFDHDSLWHSWIDNPMNIAKEIDFSNDSFETDFLDAFSLSDSPYTESCIKEYREKVHVIKEKYRQVDVQCEDLVEKLIAVDKFTINSPYYRDKVAYFLSGFETFELWKAIIQSFLFTGKYLWIYGRKNMKLFGGNFNDLFEYLDKKAVQPNMGGIDFKVLFLNPEAEEVHYAHKDQDIFESELRTTISRAKRIIGSNKVLQQCFKMYSNRREEIIIRVDNCIIYAKPHFDMYGMPNIMTNSKFEVFSASSEKGKECIKKYLAVWNEAIYMFD
ncbi:MAG: toll/interleukin-1 receptor domain-containing protein [Lachnospiraceae bacterium]|nr:toll/interleukin-1 receptor domain-containing protein [Lachnospiraceae bacterium]